MPKKPESRAKGCPSCGKPASTAHVPFCSPRCRDRDLLRWLGEGYRIPGPPAEESDLAGVDRDDDAR
ncbi:MAG TPA: DNA gyrase inhibitor YacG [Sphingomicrobium sp.]|jgi:endogenous inhibitor of DNA gyrase (YacG/DUF329 family)|nr:DNA gyrase inhibitor YacG [Sphingomicrobium sp.]